MKSKEEKAARALNRWWQNRTGTDESVANVYPFTMDRNPVPVCALVVVNAEALRVLTMYARAMSIVAERRRCRILELQGRLS